MSSMFSVVTSVYKNDNPEFVRLAFDSMLVDQTIKPNEIILVQDGPISDNLCSLLSEYEERFSSVMNIIRLEKNCGLGNALQIGVNMAKYDIIARMDSDDICLPNRFEIQLKYLEEHPETDIVGGQMTEFIDTPNNIIGTRVVPCTNDDIYEYMKSRCALNHVTVMFRRDAVLRAGNYQDWFWNEDYYLWIRMMISKCQFANLSEVLVNVRSGRDMYARRGGYKYYNSEKSIQRYMLDNKVINWDKYFINIIKRFIVQLLLPNWLRGWVFRTFARK